MHRVLLLLILMSFWPTARSAELPQSALSEIDHPLGSLGSSNCRFYRNGTWYTASDAQAHLTKKYEYLRKKEHRPRESQGDMQH